MHASSVLAFACRLLASAAIQHARSVRTQEKENTMNKNAPIIWLLCLLLVLLSGWLVGCATVPSQSAQAAVDATLLSEIAKIKAIDNHAHPWRAFKEGETDDEWDALMPDALEPSPLPLRLRPDNPEYIAAWKALYGYKYDEM